MNTFKLPPISKPVLAVVVFLIALGLAEYYELPHLLWLSLISGVASIISLIVVLIKYAIDFKI